MKVVALVTLDYRDKTYYPGEEVPMTAAEAERAQRAGLVRVESTSRRRASREKGGEEWPES